MDSNYQVQSIMSEEVNDVLGKKFSWIIRNGNLMLLVGLFFMGAVAIMVDIPVSFKASGNATLVALNNQTQLKRDKKQEFIIDFQIPVENINHFVKNRPVKLTLAYIPEAQFDGCITAIGTEIINHQIAVRASLKADLSMYSNLLITKTPAELEMMLGKKNIFNYFIN